MRNNRRITKMKTQDRRFTQLGSVVRAFPTIPLVEIRKAFEPITNTYPPILSLIEPLLARTRELFETTTPPAGSPGCKDCEHLGALFDVVGVLPHAGG